MAISVESVNEAERARIKALIEKDIESLDRILSAELTYIHSNGHVDGKSQVLEKIQSPFRYTKISRGGLDINVLGDVAVATGPMTVEFDSKGDGSLQSMSAMLTQVWVKGAHGLQMVAYQVAKVG